MPLQIIRQDITKMKVDSIVNTTNMEMIGYSGVDKAVHTITGPETDTECATLVSLGLGQAKITGGYGLPCKYVIQPSGPVWQGGLVGESAILRSCYIESLKLAKAKSLEDYMKERDKSFGNRPCSAAVYNTKVLNKYDGF